MVARYLNGAAALLLPCVLALKALPASAVTPLTFPEGYEQRRCVEKILGSNVQLRHVFVENANFMVKHYDTLAVTPQWVKAYRERIVPICGVPGSQMWANCDSRDRVFKPRSFETDAYRITRLMLNRSDRVAIDEEQVAWIVGPLTTRP